ncbi:MAG: 4-vinyl reductase [Pseudomonadota bacterium]
MLRFVINCDSSPGILSKIVVLIRRSSKDIANQKVTELEDGRIVEIDFDASKEEAQVLYKALSKTEGITKVKAYSIKAKSAEQPAAAAAYNHDSATNRIVAVFPDIASVVLGIREELEPSQVAEEMFQLGVDVAASRADQNQLTIPSAPGDLPTIIRETVLPELALIGDADYVEEGFETGLMVMSSIFTKPKSGERSSGIGGTFGSLESDAIRCDFLSGYIAGVVNAIAATAGKNFDVSEPRCRNEGHPYCLFEID